MIVAVVIENNFGTSRVLKLMASALALQCSTNWAMKTHTSGADYWIKFAIFTLNCNYHCNDHIFI